MDSLEVIQNKGYVSIADADYNRGFSEGKAEGFSAGEEKGFSTGFSEGEYIKARKMAKAMLMEGISIDKIRIISGLSEEEIKNL